MYSIILAGGSGTRLWPLSREQFPKYHLSVIPGNSSSLFEQTVARVNKVIPDKNIIVITHESQISDLKNVLLRNNKNEVSLIGEPEARNTAPAVGLAAWYIHKKDPEGVMAVLPSDHFLEPDEKFAELLKQAEQSARNYGLVTFGIRPDSPETGYGYICCGDQLDTHTYRVEKFVEKPDLDKAKRFLQDGRYLWNSGMFAFSVSALVSEFRQHLPGIAAALDQIDLDSFSNLADIYKNMDSISIDYGIMEKSAQVAVIPTDIKWNDVGSWNSYYEMSPLDHNNNSLQGRVIDVDSRNSLVISPSRITGTIGLDNMIVVDTDDALLICNREKTQDVKKVVEKLKEENAEEAVVHRTVYRPWGSFTVLKEADTFKVKTITVDPGQRLSLQRHKFRSENWVVVNGTACITLDEEVHNLAPGQSIFIPAGSLHRLENKGGETVKIVEVQTGSYLGEDDIERISDDYDRTDSKNKIDNKHEDEKECYRLFKQWLNYPLLDEETKKELLSIAEDNTEIECRFSGELEFGTGGFRGTLGAGTNRINRYIVGRATQGLANYINSTYSNEPEKKAVIAYDSRRFSRELAEKTALVFSANNIKAYIFESLRPTPELSFAIRELGCLAGVVITASHNPPRYNGYKVYNRHGGQAVPSETEEITNQISKVDLFEDVKHISKEEAIDKGLFVSIGENIDRVYLEKVKSLCHYQGKKDLKVVYSPLHGTGYPLIPRVLEELGYSNVFLVDEQTDPDPEFSTVKSPNPEDKEAFTLALKLAEEKNADLVLATDPDGDRVGCAVQESDGNYTLLNGNQVGALLVNYLLQIMKEKGKLPSRGVVVKTIVTGNLGKVIAEDHGIETAETLTGFKFIGEKIKEYEEAKDKQFIFGYEESFGYLAGTFVRDKDAVISSALIVEMAAYFREKGYSLPEVLESLYEKYGYYIEELESMELSEPSVAEEIIKKLAEINIKDIAGIRVNEKRNYISGKAVNPHTMEERTLDLPQTKAIMFMLEDESWFCVRPSGTEPKFKVYYSVTGKSGQEAQEKMNSLKEGTQALLG